MFSFVSNFGLITGLIILLGVVAFIAIRMIGRYIQRKVETLTTERVAKEIKNRQKAMQVAAATGADTFPYNHKKPKVRSKKYQRVTVLFADIQGFTRIAEQLNPEALIDELDQFFIHFDEVVERNDIEKIKTIGDAYMCAGGLPKKNRTNPIEVVLAAMEIQQHMRRLRKIKTLEHKDYWELRIGIHTGPVIAGMVGRKKVTFDIWGDTVNIASRMESSGVAGEINVTGATWQQVKGFFEAEYRGKMPIKYKGETDMYFIKGIIPRLSADEEGKIPNELFRIRLQYIRYSDLEEDMLDRLEKELSPKITYHNFKHTIDVITQTEIIGRGEKISEEEMLLVKTAALFHDTGFLIDYHNHEDNSILLAQDILPRYKYTSPQIDTICELIDVTRKGNHPKNHLEAVLSDADLDYLGRSDFIPVSETLYVELQSFNGTLPLSDWTERQIEFISNHRYYTNTAKDLRQVNKQKQLEILRQMQKLQIQTQ